MNDSPYVALPHPLDRVQEIDEAVASIESMSRTHIRVYTGVEGIGKTHLLRAIRKRCSSRPKWLTVHHAFKRHVPFEPFSILLSLREAVSIAAAQSGGRVSFLAFDLVACQYVRLTRGAVQAEKLEEVLAGHSDPAYRSLIMSAGKAAATLSLGVLDDVIERALRSGLRKARKDEAAGASAARLLEGLLYKDSDELLALMPALLAGDLLDYQEDAAERRIIFFFDDYGNIWGDSESHQLRPEREVRDHVLRALMSAESHCVFIVADRSTRFWEEHEASEHRLLVQLEGIPDKACREYLAMKGLPESLRDGIVGQSRGLPYWLDIALDQFHRLSKQLPEVSAADLSWLEKDIVRIVQIGLTAQEMSTVKHVSSAVWFDKALFEKLVAGRFATGYPATEFNTFSQLSMIEDVGAGLFAVHDTFRIPLRNWLEEHEPRLLADLDKVREEHYGSTGLIGSILSVLQAHQVLIDGISDLKSGRRPAEDINKVLDSVFVGGKNPAHAFRAESEATLKALDRASRDLDTLQSMFKAAGGDSR